jgi:hypothetical protein
MPEQTSEPVVVSLGQMVAELAPQIAEVIKKKYASGNDREGISVFANGGEDQWWFEIWEKRGVLPPRKIFSSPQQYSYSNNVIFEGNVFIEMICKEVYKL